MGEDAISTPTRGEPNISLEEIDADEVVGRIQAIPLQNVDGPKRADEVLAAIGNATDHAPTHTNGTRTTEAGRRGDGG